MLLLNHLKLDAVLKEKGLTLSGLARTAGISRQSLYRYLRGESVLSAAFEKILETLGVGLMKIADEKTGADRLLEEAPVPVQNVARRLIEFSEQEGATLILFGSRVTGKQGVSLDWDFGLLFDQMNPETEHRFRIVRQELLEKAFPYRIDLVLLNSAPGWFLDSVARRFLCIKGDISPQTIREQKAA